MENLLDVIVVNHDNASDFELASKVSASAELPLLLVSEEGAAGYSPHPAENSRQPFLCSPFYNIVSVRLVSGA